MAETLSIIKFIGMTFALASSVIATIFYFQSMQDGVVEEDEKHFMHTVHLMSFLGLCILIPWEILVMGYALVEQGAWIIYILTPENWCRIIILGIIVMNAGLRRVREIPEWFPSAITVASLAFYYYISIKEFSNIALLFISYLICLLVSVIILQLLRRIYIR